MKIRYLDLIEQTFDFPQAPFRVEDGELYFNEVPLMDIIKQYGTPLKITYLPRISEQIQYAKRLFNVAFAKIDYNAEYFYSYCTKSSHFHFVLEEALKNDIHLETSSAFDIDIIERLFEERRLTKDNYIICNGLKKPEYTRAIAKMINRGFHNVIPVLDNKNELEDYDKLVKGNCKIGIRIASEEEPSFMFYTSRLGMRYNEIPDFYRDKIKKNSKFQFKMLHFFINTGMRDTSYYWSELNKAVTIYCEMKKQCKELDSLNIGGGLPIKNSLAFDYDYEYMIEEIATQIKRICESHKVPEPNIFTEFGSHTVGESGAMLFNILNQKQQNDREYWDIIDSSFMTTLPDTWAISQRYIMLAVNNWTDQYERVFLGGLTCDSQDYYNEEAHINAIYLPKYDRARPQYIGFFHTGAYQESLGGYGGVQHCLIPLPKHIIISRDEEGEYYTKLFTKEQSAISMLKHLGY
ncbi:MAG: arginine decarboxylase [Bacteroidetes bacterium]|nr:arginine decarboxylase [Bacteroidota bacterium]MBU1721108.1 arginine decarboxylase [Bacteroidota bacterium]